MASTKFVREPIDQICLFLIFIFTVIIVILIGSNKICYQQKCLFNNQPQVKEFSWANQKIGATDRAFYLVFDRPMSKESVEENLKIEPPINGRISWSGKRLVYSLDGVVPYGKDFRISLSNAQEKFRGQEKLGAEIEPFVAEFKSRDRAFAYIGSQGEESGRIILNNSTKQNKDILTPDNLTVLDFKFTPNSEKIVFSATDNKDENEEFKQINIYEVTTGLSNDFTTKIPGELTVLLNGSKFQNNKFDLAGDNGEIIVVQRINQEDPQDFDLWKLEQGKIPQRLNTKGGDFIVTPDGDAVAIAKGEGIAILSLQEQQDKSLVNFLPKYGQVLTFSKDGSSAAMVNFNKDDSQKQYTKSLFYVNNQGLEKELVSVAGTIVDCEFNHTGTQLFCLFTERTQTSDEELEETPYFVGIDIKSGQIIPLLALPKYQDIEISMAPDGLGLLFDQLVTENDVTPKQLAQISPDEELLTDSAELILTSRLWLLTLPNPEAPQAQLQEFPQVSGFKPQWSP